eukprot:2168435-Prymnesium_polylepis.2
MCSLRLRPASSVYRLTVTRDDCGNPSRTTNDQVQVANQTERNDQSPLDSLHAGETCSHKPNHLPRPALGGPASDKIGLPRNPTRGPGTHHPGRTPHRNRTHRARLASPQGQTAALGDKAAPFEAQRTLHNPE